LLIFDNATSHEAVDRFLPPIGNGRILVTTQSPSWPARQAIEVQALPAGVAARFLCSRTGDADQAAARTLADELGGLPLALEQAAAYVLATGTTLARYLRLFQERRSDLLARGEPTAYRKTIATTWQVAFARLNQLAPLATALLRLLAFWAPEPAPLDLLLKPAEDLINQIPADLAPLIGDEVAINDAVGELRRYSLITFAGASSVVTHRLVQAVTKDQLPTRLASQWREVAAFLINAAIPADPESPANWSVFADLLPHAQAVLGASSAGMFRTANYLAYSGNYSAAIKQFTTMLPVIEQILGAEHPHMLICRQYLATWTGEAGDPASARDQYAALLPFQERILGAEHPDTLNVRHNLARWTGQAGDPFAARDKITSLVPIHERVLGAEHPDTLTTRSNLARWTGEAGDPGTARDQFAAALPIMERVLGPDHSAALATRHSFAYWASKAEANG
jgi:Tetratricopeptide repeat